MFDLLFAILETLGGAGSALRDSRRLPLPLRIFGLVIGLLLLAILAAFVFDMAFELFSPLFQT